MRIENGYLQQSMLCSKNNRNAVGNFSDTMNKAQECISNKISTRDSYVNSTDYSNFGIYTQNSISQDIELPIETERYKIEDATYVNGVAAYEIVDKQTGKDFYIREDQLAIQRDEKTGMEFLINMDQPFSYNVTMTSELKNLLNDLSDKRNIDIKEIPLQGGLVVKRDPKTGLNYLSIKGNEAQGVSVIITSDKDIETLNKLADEFQKYPVSSQRSTAGLYALLELSLIHISAMRIKEKYPKLPVVLVTAYMNYALDGYKVKASRFLLKDNLADTIEECMDDLIAEINKNRRILEFRFVEGTIKLYADDIIYIETELHKNVFYTEKGTFQIYKKLDELENEFKDMGFVRAHLSFLVNMKYITKISSYVMTLTTGKKIPVPKARYAQVKREYMLYKGEE